MSSPLYIAEVRAKFAREAFVDLPKDAPLEQRQAAEALMLETRRKFTQAFMDSIGRGHKSRAVMGDGTPTLGGRPVNSEFLGALPARIGEDY